MIAGVRKMFIREENVCSTVWSCPNLNYYNNVCDSESEATNTVTVIVQTHFSASIFNTFAQLSSKIPTTEAISFKQQ